MCGIFGIVNGKKNRTASRAICDLIEQAFVVNSLRGPDATGLFQIDGSKIYMHKKAIHGAEFAISPEAHPYINDADTCKVLVAHNRAATSGDITDKNAHPFLARTPGNRTLIGVHNGTLQGWSTKDSPFSVDSEWAIDLISSKGYEAFKEIQGAYTFVWYDEENPDKLMMIRNRERPMFVGFVKGQDRMLFASEYMMLGWLAHRNNVELEADIIDLAPGKCYSFDVDNPREFTAVDVPLPATSTRTSSYYDSGWKNYEHDRQKTFIKGFLACLGPSSKTVSDAAAAAARREKKPRVRLGEYATPEEVRLAKTTDDYDTTVLFSPDTHDIDTKECWGTVVYPSGDSVAGVIRRVPETLYKEWRGMDGLSCKVVGATTKPSGDSINTKDLVLILSRNVREAEASELATLEAAISAEVNKFRQRGTTH